jgi:hypothetical protein
MVMISQFQGSVMDQERRYRFLLWRFWDERPRVLFVLLNPSTGNEMTNDPTIVRLCDFSERWGYGGFYLCNLYPQVTPDPKQLLPETRNHGANTPAIQMALKLTVLTVCGWGDGIRRIPDGDHRAYAVYDMLESPMCFGLTKSGNPKHPLYLPVDTDLAEFPLCRLEE